MKWHDQDYTSGQGYSRDQNKIFKSDFNTFLLRYVQRLFPQCTGRYMTYMYKIARGKTGIQSSLHRSSPALFWTFLSALHGSLASRTPLCSYFAYEHTTLLVSGAIELTRCCHPSRPIGFSQDLGILTTSSLVGKARNLDAYTWVPPLGVPGTFSRAPGCRLLRDHLSQYTPYTPVLLKKKPWINKYLAAWCKKPTHWKIP